MHRPSPDIVHVDPERPQSLAGLDAPALDEGAVVVLLADAAGHEAGWAGRAAVAIARDWSAAGRRVVLADADLEGAGLTGIVGGVGGEGVADVLLYGASPARVARRAPGSAFFFMSAGTVVPEPDRVYGHPRWKGVMGAFREAQSVLILYVPESDNGSVDTLVSGGDRVYRLAARGEAVDAEAGIEEEIGAEFDRWVPPTDAGGEESAVDGPTVRDQAEVVVDASAFDASAFDDAPLLEDASVVLDDAFLDDPVTLGEAPASPAVADAGVVESAPPESLEPEEDPAVLADWSSRIEAAMGEGREEEGLVEVRADEAASDAAVTGVDDADVDERSAGILAGETVEPEAAVEGSEIAGPTERAAPPAPFTEAWFDEGEGEGGPTVMTPASTEGAKPKRRLPSPLLLVLLLVVVAAALIGAWLGYFTIPGLMSIGVARG